MSHHTKHGNIPAPFHRLLSSGGDGSGTTNAVGNYSSTPLQLKLTAPAGQSLVVMGLSVDIGAASIGAEVYGLASGSALSTGITVFVTNPAGAIVYYLMGVTVPMKSNAELIHRLGEQVFFLNGFATGDDHLLVHGDFEPGVELPPGWSLVVFLQDDFSSLVSEHRWLAEGYVKYGIDADTTV